jgi:hypothetical protein
MKRPIMNKHNEHEQTQTNTNKKVNLFFINNIQVIINVK